MNSHFLLQVSSMQFGLDGRIDEPLVPIPRRRRWGRRSGPTVVPPGDDPGADVDPAGAVAGTGRPAAGDPGAGEPATLGRRGVAPADHGARE